VQLGVAASVAASLAVSFPASGVIGLAETAGGSIKGSSAAERCAEVVAGADAVLLGPGLDDADETAELVAALLPHLGDEAALVLDAYALGVLPKFRKYLTQRPLPAVLTPNGVELGRLLERDAEPEPPDVAEVAERYRSCVTARATIADPRGRTWRVPSGAQQLGCDQLRLWHDVRPGAR